MTPGPELLFPENGMNFADTKNPPPGGGWRGRVWRQESSESDRQGRHFPVGIDFGKVGRVQSRDKGGGLLNKG